MCRFFSILILNFSQLFDLLTREEKGEVQEIHSSQILEF